MTREMKDLEIVLTRRDFEGLFCIFGKGCQFSSEGLDALYGYLKERRTWAKDRGLDLLDVISVFSRFKEYKDLGELKDNYKEYKSIEEVKRDFCVVLSIDENRFLVQLPEILL